MTIDDEILQKLKDGSSLEKYFDYAKTRRPEHQWQKCYLLKEGDIYVEVGAFWGTSGIKASEQVGLSGRVILIEPSPETFKMLQLVCEHFNLHNATLVNKAVWNRKTDLYLNTEKRATDHYISSNGVKVQGDLLDNIFDELSVEKVDLLAADVEGAEIELLGGCYDYFVQKRIKNIALAVYHKPHYFESAGIFLTSLGFRSVLYDTAEQGVIYGCL